MTPAERLEQQFAEIRIAARARAALAPPLTERQIERLAFLIEPSIPVAKAGPAPLPAAA